ncbi:integrase domain-containing protein [Undibacterium sp. FT79W]|uniref:integrase domain-containing protein n=1 Tax=Undibacterium sp. FT79W TaxID=2762296 RepID=UPI00164A130A|nr:integrase domain-containing protein [Undibacterium sp. FT79W]MBC3879725.1 integrase domain-containing protein [Undibacterium sp. FT79W]
MAIIYDFEKDIAGCNLHPLLKEELRKLFKSNLSKPHSKTRVSTSPLGIKTQRMRSLCLLASLETLQKNGLHRFTTLSSLKEKHIQFLIDAWIAKNQGRGTIENKLTYLAALASWLGKANIVKDVSEYEQIRQLPKRSGTTMTDKSWESRNIDAQQMIAQIAADNPHVAIQLALQITFGLRTEESMLLRPFDVLMRRSGQLYLMIADGTKGGRPRRIDVQDEADLDVIELAKNYINRKSKTTIPEEYTFQEWKNKYYYLLKKHGFTKKNLGVTAHGLRHQYMQNLYKQLTGSDSPVRGGEQPAPDILAHARQVITEHAGHSRASKANAYIGSHAAMKAKTSKDLTNRQILDSLQKNGGNKMEAAKQLNCSRSYLYQRLKDIDHHDHA